ncbi:hypothetical protein UFOVP609_23 [uncultured Caudovirales phage]|uniref:Uncharacterized protein n=1 Tax=uncultured Caudovirales phage TaxID=2100421 RepID=A0A6J5N2V1_9CAUD|nr:hypothetical protein UFOVP609_23 [uncultured Caudovirales phage]
MSELNDVLASAMVKAYNQGLATERESTVKSIQADRQRIIQDLQTDAVISTGMPVEWLERVVKIVEGAD